MKVAKPRYISQVTRVALRASMQIGNPYKQKIGPGPCGEGKRAGASLRNRIRE